MEDLEKSNGTIGIYLKKKEVDKLTASELKILLQVLRMLNSIRCWLRFKFLLNKDHNKMFDFRNQTEVLFQIIASLKEGTKEFYREIDKKLDHKYIPSKVIGIYEEYKDRLKDRNLDDYFKVVEYIRHNIGSHFSERIYENTIKSDGETKDDILLGIAVGDTLNDFLLTEPYTVIFSEVADLCPKEIDKNKFYDWLFERTIEESNNFCKLLDGIMNEMLKGKVYQKYIDEQQVLSWKN